MALDPALRVQYPGGSYPVYLRRGLLTDGSLADILDRHAPGRRPAVIADRTVAESVHPALPAGTPHVTFPPGEASKTRDTWAQLTDALLERGYGRDTVVLALGGGVTGDLAGFVAATYHRGVPVIQLPTSLLAMVDSSIGGKTGVDSPIGKNMVGAYHQPAAVVTDPKALETLPDPEYRNGLAESVKLGLVADAAHFEWIEAHADALLARQPEAVDRLIHRTASLKAGVVGQDERDGGVRMILNAGHTVGHAIEAASGYRIPHGQAVAVGLVAEARLAERIGVAGSGTAERLRRIIASVGLATEVPETISCDVLLEAMRRDKKNRGGTIHFVLSDQAGSVAHDGGWTTPVPEAQIRQALRPAD